jgi:hypothetical protein
MTGKRVKQGDRTAACVIDEWAVLQICSGEARDDFIVVEIEREGIPSSW